MQVRVPGTLVHLILSEIIIKVKRQIADDKIKILVSTEPESKCGDLIVTMNRREQIIPLIGMKTFVLEKRPFVIYVINDRCPHPKHRILLESC